MDQIIHLQGNPSSSLAPLFLVHPISGCMLPYVRLGNLTFDDGEQDYFSSHQTQRPVYGINSYFLLDEASRRAHPEHRPTGLKQTARLYLDQIRASGLKRDDQPWLLGGWSLGGMIAYQMCSVLQELQRTEHPFGDNRAGVRPSTTVLDCIMIDSPCPKNFPSFEDHDELLGSVTAAMRSVQMRTQTLKFDVAAFLRSIPRQSSRDELALSLSPVQASHPTNDRVRYWPQKLSQDDGFETLDAARERLQSHSSFQSSHASSDTSSIFDEMPYSPTPSTLSEISSSSTPPQEASNESLALGGNEEMDLVSVTDSSVQMMLRICLSVYTFLDILSAESAHNGASPWGPKESYGGKVTLIRCSRLSRAQPGLSERRRNYSAGLFADPWMGWDDALVTERNFRCLSYSSAATHDECFDLDFVGETSELMRIALQSLVR